MHRIGIATGIVVVMLIGIGIAGAQTPPHETLTPPALKTPEPAPTPTPAQIACEQFDLAVQDAWWGAITQDPDKDANAKYHKDLAKRLRNRLSWTMVLRETEPAMERMVSPLYWTFKSKAENLNFTFRYGYDRMVIGARQMERWCFARGYEKQFNVLPDVLAEYACVDHHFVNVGNLSPGIQSLYWDCKLTDFDKHNHSLEYADINHTHGGGDERRGTDR